MLQRQKIDEGDYATNQNQPVETRKNCFA